MEKKGWMTSLWFSLLRSLTFRIQMEKKGWMTEVTEYDLPDDVLTEVLSRVPAKSLLRFKSVSKHWCSLILNPNFISLHHSRAQPYCSVSLIRDQKLSMCLLPDQTSIHHLDLPFAGLHGVPDFIYTGYCNGLVCFSTISDVVICNPATKEYRRLPQPPYHTGQWRTHCLAFGFDSRTNDYLVARVAALSQTTCVDNKIHVYGMGADSWEEIAATMPNHMFFPDFPPCVSLDGVFYWLTYDSTTGVHVIHALNTVERLLEQISLPTGLSSECQRLDLCLLNDSPALLQHDDSKRGEMWFDVWLMDKYGVGDFWTKKNTIGPLLENGYPFWFHANSEVLLIEWNNKQILSYDHRTQDIKEYNQLRNVPGGLYIIQVFPYVESLVPVKRRVATSADS